MRKLSLFLSLAALSLAGSVKAQHHCYSDEMRKRAIAKHPEIILREAEVEKQIQEGLKKIDMHKYASKTTTSTDLDTGWYEIPVVVHVIHDYGAEYMTDDVIFNAVKTWNITFAKQNSDTATVIAPFKKYIGNPKIRLHLATLDPTGRPTKGITRHRTYLATQGGDDAKYDDWAPSSYLNLWFINRFSADHAEAAAYAYKPGTAEYMPYYDGVISLYSYITTDNTINHEIGHTMNLDHPWGNNNSAGAGTCADGGTDNVDDTPPTIGHNVTGCVPSALYDTVCATNYFKVYPTMVWDPVLLDSVLVNVLVNYPDTVNAENIMDYTYCSKMFTKGQVDRMHATLNGDVAGRNNLGTASNLAFTGALAPRPDLKPIPDFACYYSSRVQYFTCPGTPLRMVNKTWNDTITKLQWNLSNGASPATNTFTSVDFNTTITPTFTDGGWVNVTMTATGNHSGDSTIVFDKSVFVADAVATPASNLVEEFDPAGTLEKWPLFNYYNNEFKWEVANVGMYDNHCIKYNGYDARLNPAVGLYPRTGTPLGDYDDMFSIPVDLSTFTSGNCYMNFFTSGAARSSNALDLSDTLQISYSVDNAKSWTTLANLSKGALVNKGAVSIPYAPISINDWVGRTLSLPTAARKNYVVFRFRYRPGIDYNGYGISTGNNFYIDRINFANSPVSVANVNMGSLDAAVVPNPTNGDAFVVIRDASNSEATVTVSDITGKVIYTVKEQINGNEARIEIPQSAIEVKGIYMVHVTTGGLSKTQKLVVY